MAIDQMDVIDVIGLDKATRNVILTISDHLDWKDVDAHLELLEEKINLYFGFVETGEILEQYPEAEDKEIIIEIVAQYLWPEEAIEFISEANKVAKQLNITITHKLFE